MANPDQVAKQIKGDNLTHTSQALVLQAYSLSVLEQPAVDFSGDGDLKKFQSKINDGLALAKAHATSYLNEIQPAIITNIANIESYYTLHNAVPVTLPVGSTVESWMLILDALRTRAKLYETDAKNVVAQLQELSKNLTTDAGSFKAVVIDLNAAVNGDNGALASLDQQLNGIQGKINGAIAGVVVGGLLVVGGAIAIVVGVAFLVPSGAFSTGLIIGGVAAVVAGSAVLISSAVTLAGLIKDKSTMLREEEHLKGEVILASGVSSAYNSLATQVESSVQAATQMANAWETLGADLESMAKDLNDGILDDGALRTLFLTAANNEVKTLQTDIATIKAQMAGVQVVVAEPGQTVDEALDALIERAKASV